MGKIEILDLKHSKDIESQKKKNCKKKKNMTVWENFTIANKKACKHHINTCIFIDFSTSRFKDNSWSQKTLWLIFMKFETGTKNKSVGTSPNSKTKKENLIGARFEI